MNGATLDIAVTLPPGRKFGDYWCRISAVVATQVASRPSGAEVLGENFQLGTMVPRHAVPKQSIAALAQLCGLFPGGGVEPEKLQVAVLDHGFELLGKTALRRLLALFGVSEEGGAPAPISTWTMSPGMINRENEVCLNQW